MWILISIFSWGTGVRSTDRGLTAWRTGDDVRLPTETMLSFGVETQMGS